MLTYGSWYANGYCVRNAYWNSLAALNGLLLAYRYAHGVRNLLANVLTGPAANCVSLSLAFWNHAACCIANVLGSLLANHFTGSVANSLRTAFRNHFACCVANGLLMAFWNHLASGVADSLLSAFRNHLANCIRN